MLLAEGLCYEGTFAQPGFLCLNWLDKTSKSSWRYGITVMNFLCKERLSVAFFFSLGLKKINAA